MKIIAILTVMIAPILTASAQTQPKPIRGPGWVDVLHIVESPESPAARQYRVGIEEREPRIAGATHHFISDSSEFERVKPAETLRAPDEHHALVLVLDHEGREGTPFSVRLDDRNAGARLEAAITNVSRGKSVAEYNLPKRSTLAISGYDPVSYMSQSGPKKGSNKIEATFRGVIYRFATTANRDTFVRDPRRYLPAYGGWCATAMADNQRVEVDPRNYIVNDGRLFLFYKGAFVNARKDWRKDPAKLERRADTNWRAATGELPIKPKEVDREGD